jgi:hypothetical protein
MTLVLDSQGLKRDQVPGGILRAGQRRLCQNLGRGGGGEPGDDTATSDSSRDIDDVAAFLFGGRVPQRRRVAHGEKRTH